MQINHSHALDKGTSILGRAAIAFAVTTTTAGLVQLPSVRAKTVGVLGFYVDAVVARPDPLPANLSQRALEDLYLDAERILSGNHTNLDSKLQPVLLEIERRESASAVAFREARAANFAARRDEADAIIAELSELLTQG